MTSENHTADETTVIIQEHKIFYITASNNCTAQEIYTTPSIFPLKNHMGNMSVFSYEAFSLQIYKVKASLQETLFRIFFRKLDIKIKI